MKILHISNFGDKHNGRLYWNQCYKISNGLIRNGHNVYNFSERDRSRSDLLNKFNNVLVVKFELVSSGIIIFFSIIFKIHANFTFVSILRIKRVK